MNSGIYEIVNTANGKRYVGSAVNLRKRFRFHRWSLNTGRHHSAHLQRAWTKYGSHAFQFRKLLICSKEMLLMFEQRSINAIKPAYNISPNAGSSLGRKLSLETRSKISASHKGRTYIKGWKHSAESSAKMSASQIGNKNFLGHRHSQETRAKLRAKALNRKLSLETRAKISASGKARWERIRMAVSA